MTESNYIARCPKCHRIVYAAANRGVDPQEIGELIVGGFSVERMTDEEVREAAWGHTDECSLLER